MNRRTFLQSIATILAASQIPAALITSEPAAPTLVGMDWASGIDWTTWNVVEMRSGLYGVTAKLNSVEVTHLPMVMEKIARCIHIGPDYVRFSSPIGQAETSGMLMEIPEMESDKEIIVGCTMKISETENSIRDMSFDDLYLEHDREASMATGNIVFVPKPFGMGLRIDGLVAKPSPEFARGSGSFTKYLEQDKKIQAMFSEGFDSYTTRDKS